VPPIAGRQFKLFGELEAEINRIRKEYRPHNEPVQGLDGALLQCYMRYHEGIEGAELRHGEMRTIEIRHNPGVFRKSGAPECVQYQIWIVFADGYGEPFSYMLDQNSLEIEYARAAADAPFPITHLLPFHAIPLPQAGEGEG
jgi:hypothetical protein